MSYSQRPILEMLEKGQFPGESGVSRHVHIETVMSNVYIFSTNVYKLYKNDNQFINANFRDLSSKEGRFSFTKRDFEWNTTLSPTIYTDLVGLRIIDGALHVVSPDESADELVFKMKRVDTGDVLFEKIVNGTLSESDYFAIGKQLGESLSKIQKKLPGQNFYSLFESRLNDLKNWIGSAVAYIPPEEAGRYCNFLQTFLLKNKPWFESTLSSEVTADGDFHSQNAIYADGTLHLMDTFAPKEEWGAGHVHLPFYRIGLDIWTLSGEESFFEAYLRGYEAGSERIVDRALDDVFVVYACCIAVTYFYMLQNTDPSKAKSAKKFHAFLQKYFEAKKLAAY